MVFDETLYNMGLKRHLAPHRMKQEKLLTTVSSGNDTYTVSRFAPDNVKTSPTAHVMVFTEVPPSLVFILSFIALR